MAAYLGDFRKNETIYHQWETSDANGNSVNPSGNKVIVAYKNSGTTQTTAGVSGFIGWDGLSGVHNLSVDTSSGFFTTGDDYSIIISGAVINNITSNSVICRFSVENRYDTGVLNSISGDVTTLTANMATVSGNLVTATANLATVSGILVAVSGSLDDNVAVSGFTAAALTQIITSGNAAEWNASGVWNYDISTITTSGYAGKNLHNLYLTHAGAVQIVASGTSRYMKIYDADTPTGTPSFTFKLYNFGGSDPTVSLQAITGRDRVDTN